MPLIQFDHQAMRAQAERLPALDRPVVPERFADASSGLQKHILRRHGLRPLTIEAALLCRLDCGDPAEGPSLQIGLFELRDGYLAVALELMIAGQERSHAEAIVLDDPQSVIDWLGGYDPAGALPCLVSIDDRQAVSKLQADLARAAQAVSESRAALTNLFSALFPNAAPASATH